MKAYHIYLLRHGMTQANQDGKYVGTTDVPLSAEGEEQLVDLRQKYIYPQADIFFSSPLTRCTRTLSLLYPGAAPQIVDGLAECNFGDFEGRTMNELKGDLAYQEWIAKKGMTSPPNGESSEDFQKRCCAAFEQIVGTLLKAGQNKAVIMAHGGTIMFILGTYGYPRRPFYEWLAGNGMGYEIIITPSLWMSSRAMDIAAHIPDCEDELAGLTNIFDENQETGDEQ